MTPRRLALLALSVVAASVLPAQGTLNRGFYEDSENGFKVKVPQKWTQVPTQVDEKWIVAQFQCPKEFEGHHKLDDSYLHKPLMRVIMFDHEVIKQRYEKVKAGETEITKLKLPYRDYKDYCRRNLNKGGWFLHKEQKGRQGDLQVTRYQIKVEKGAMARLRYICWVFHGQQADFAVEFEFLEHHVDKLEREAVKPLRSFHFIPRAKDANAGSKGAEATPTEWDRDEWKALPLGERFKRRSMVEKRRAKKAIDSLPEGWTVQETKSFYVLSHAQKKYTQRITAAAEACRSWLDKRLGRVNDEYVMKGVLRICKDYDEYKAYRTGSGDAFNAEDREVVTYEDRDEGNAGLQYGTMFYGLFNQYIYDKDEYLYRYLPVWLHWALWDYFDTAVMKGRKIVFRPDDFEKEAFHELRRNDGVKSARELMNMTYEDYVKGNKAKLHIDEQFANLLRFLEGSGRRHKLLRGRDFILDYMKESVRAAEKYLEENPPEMSSANTEEEEEARAQKQRQAGAKRRTAILKMVNEKLCNWSDKEWDGLNKAYARFCK